MSGGQELRRKRPKSQKLLVFERRPKNAALLARVSGLELHEVRSLSQFQDSLKASEPLVCAIEVSISDPFDSIRLVRDVKRTTRSAVIALPDLGRNKSLRVRREVEAFLYEAGADVILASMLDLVNTSRFLRNCVGSNGTVDGMAGTESADDTIIPIRTWVWDRLPWKRFASAGSQ